MGLEARPLWQHLLWSTLEYVSQIQIRALCVWLTEIGDGLPGFYKLYEGPGGVWDLASVATPLVVHPGYVSQIYI